MGIKNINITKIMYDELSKILNNNEDYVKKYIISDINDLFDEKNKFLLYII